MQGGESCQSGQEKRNLMKNGWFAVGEGDDVIYWQSNLIEKIWIGKTIIEIWLIDKQKYVFFSKEEQDDPGYMTVETSGLSILEFNKLKAYFRGLIGIASAEKTG